VRIPRRKWLAINRFLRWRPVLNLLAVSTVEALGAQAYCFLTILVRKNRFVSVPE
jgi:hypothetical protein